MGNSGREGLIFRRLCNTFMAAAIILSFGFAKEGKDGENTCFKSTSSPFVLKEGGIYKMWYTDRDCRTNEFGVYYAVSRDGQQWERYGDYPVLSVSKSRWDNERVGSPAIIKKGGLYRMWYRGDGSGRQQIGYAVSRDGIKWRKYIKPILAVGQSSDWDDRSIVASDIVFVNGLFYMWYRGSRSPNQEYSSIGLAFSKDGVHWKKYNANPILKPGPRGSWDDKQVCDPTVLFEEKTKLFQMWFSGESYKSQAEVCAKMRSDNLKAGAGKMVGYAVSNDGILWDKLKSNPVIVLMDKIEWLNRRWQVDRVDNPCVILDKGVYKMWFRIKARRASFIGYTVSEDGLAWAEPKRVKFFRKAINE